MTVVRLSCNHAIYEWADAMLGELLWCRHCHKDRPVAELNAPYRWTCKTCHTGRRCGAALLTALHGLDRHCRSHPTHVGVVMSGEVTVSTTVPRLEKLPFGVADDPPY